MLLPVQALARWHVCVLCGTTFIGAKPEERGEKEFVLLWVIEDFIAVAHIHVDHPVGGIGPDDGQVSAAEHIFEPDGIVRRIECEQDSDAGIQARIRSPDIPLVCGRADGGAEASCERMRRVIDSQLCRQRWPAIAIED